MADSSRIDFWTQISVNVSRANNMIFQKKGQHQFKQDTGEGIKIVNEILE